MKISSEKCILMSDCDKGLLEVEEVLEDWVVKAFCCHHLKKNFVMKFECELSPLFWSAASVRTSSAFEAVMNKIKEVKTSAEAYLQGIVSKSLFYCAVY